MKVHPQAVREAAADHTVHHHPREVLPDPTIPIEVHLHHHLLLPEVLPDQADPIAVAAVQDLHRPAAVHLPVAVVGDHRPAVAAEDN